MGDSFDCCGMGNKEMSKVVASGEMCLHSWTILKRLTTKISQREVSCFINM